VSKPADLFHQRGKYVRKARSSYKKKKINVGPTETNRKLHSKRWKLRRGKEATYAHVFF